MKIRPSPASIAIAYAAFAAVWIVASDALLGLVSLDAVSLGRMEIAKGMAFILASSALLYFLLRAWPVLPDQSRATEQTSAGKFELRRLALLLIVLSLSVPLIGIAIFTVQARQDEQGSLADLKIIVDGKAAQIENWLAERNSDAAVLMASPGFIERVVAVKRNGDPIERGRVLERLKALRQTYFYDAVEMLDADGNVMMSVGDSRAAAGESRKLAVDSMATGRARMSGFFRDEKNRVHLVFVAPLMRGSSGREPVAAVLLFVDPEQFLYPLIQSWPNADTSGETLLVRRDGDEVTYLNKLRFRDNAPLSKFADFGAPVLAAKVVWSTAPAGTMQAVDYRGVTVLAAHREVSGTEWHLIAKLDRSEALQGALEAALWAGAVALLAAILVAIASLMLIRQQNQSRQLALRLQADNLLKQFYDLPFIGMAITSATTRIRVSFNDRLCQMLGYTRDEFAEKSWQDVTHPGDIGAETAEYRRLEEGTADGFVIEKRFVRKDGGIVRAIADVKCVRAPNRSVVYYLAMVQDISERRAAEESLRESEERYRLVVENSQDAILLTDPDGRVLAANPAACRIFGRTEDELKSAGRGDVADLSDPRLKPALEQRGKTGTFSGELTLLRKDGSRFPADVTTAVFRDMHGNSRSSMIVRDISERKRTEELVHGHVARLQAALMQTVEVATILSEMRDPYTAGHEKRVAQIAVAIGREMAFDDNTLEGIQIAGYLHDIGKITIPSEILSKPGKLNAAEFELVKGHAQASYEVLKNVEFPWPVADMVRQHHERIDGSGYPQGLKGGQMLPGAKVLAVADVVEAMASHRPYRPGLGIAVALAEIERGRGKSYEPEVADACLRLFREKGFQLPA